MNSDEYIVSRKLGNMKVTYDFHLIVLSKT